MTRLPVLGLLLFALPISAAEPFDKAVAPFVERHCVGCHGPDVQEAGVRLDKLTGVTAENRTVRTMIHAKIASGKMPPKAKPRPVDANTRAALAGIADAQRALGVPGTRRLNRRELAAALRDVTGSTVDFALSLPADGTVAGFDTGADGLPEAADAVAQWLTVTRRAVDGLRFRDADSGPVFDADLTKTKDPKKALDDWKAKGASGKLSGVARPGLGLLIEPRSPGEREEFSVAVPTAADRQGVLRLTLEVSRLKPFADIPDPRLWVRIGGQDLDHREITTGPDKLMRLVYEVQLGDLIVQAKGVTVSLSNRVEMPYAVPGFENEEKENPKEPIPGGSGLYRPAFDRKALQPEKQPAPHIVLHRITVEPNVKAAWPPPSWKASVGELTDDTATAAKLLTAWTDRAWRRPSSEAERAPFLKLYAKLRGDGLAFDPALRAAFQSVLPSPQFRYLADPADKEEAVAQHAIASRLAFLLTGEPPDAELRKLAKHLGATWVPSLALSFADGVGTATLSRNALGVDVPATANYRTVFERLFPPADKAQRKEAEARLALDRSVLDTAGEGVKDFRRQLGTEDRKRLDQYLDSIREVEKRIGDSKDILDRGRPKFDEAAVKLEPQGKNGMREHIELMMDLIALAFQTDMTRVATHSLGGEGGPNYDECKTWAQAAGAPVRGAHDVHHKGQGAADSPEAKVLEARDLMLVECLARLMTRLKGVRAADGTLLDHTVILFGGAQISSHSGKSYPLLLAGGRKLGFTHGRHLKWDGDKTPVSNLYLTILQQLGCPVAAFKESTGPLAEVLA